MQIFTPATLFDGEPPTEPYMYTHTHLMLLFQNCFTWTLINNLSILLPIYCSSSYSGYLVLSSPPMGGQDSHHCCPHLRSCAWLSALSNRPATPKISPSSHLESSFNIRLPNIKPTIKPTMGHIKPMAIVEPTMALIKPTKAPSHWPHWPRRLVMASSASPASLSWLH